MRAWVLVDILTQNTNHKTRPKARSEHPQKSFIEREVNVYDDKNDFYVLKEKLQIYETDEFNRSLLSLFLKRYATHFLNVVQVEQRLLSQLPGYRETL